MYHPGITGYNAQGQWQQPPPPASGPPPPPPPMSAEAAAAYKNYGYGNVAPRSGPHGGRGPNLPPGQPSMSHQPPGGQYPPAKRAKYDRNMPPPHGGTPPYQGPPYQPVAYQASPLAGPSPQYQAMPGAAQPYYPSPTTGHPAYPPPHAGLPQHPYQYPTQIHQPMLASHHQPPQPYQAPEGGGSGPPLAVALMRATPMAPVSRVAEKHKSSNQTHYNANLPPPPPMSSAPPPPPPPEAGIPSGPKGLASLPVRPTTAALPSNPTTPSTANTSMPPTPGGIPTGPSAHKTTIKRDTRPLPPQSRHVKDSIRGTGHDGSSRSGGSSEVRGKGPPTGPSRGGRGGGRGGGRSGFDGPRGPNRQQHNHIPQNRRDERFDHSQQNKEKGYKRTFSQTGPPANSPRGPSNRPRRNSDAASSNANIPTGPKKGQMSNAKRRERTIEGSPAPSIPNNKSLKRTLTDFRIESLEIPMVNWIWKAAPLSQILAQMNLKEKEEITAKKEEEAADTAVDAHSIPEERIEESGDSLQVPPEETASTVAAPHPEAPVPGSVELQRSDSRPEKRKHARDEDEEDQDVERQHEIGEELKDDVAYPVGKKVRSEKGLEADAGTVGSSDTAIPAIANDTVEDTSVKHSDQETPIDTVTDEADVDYAVASHEARPEESDDVSVTSDSSEEVADSIIANRTHEETQEDRGSPTPMPDDDDEPLIIRDIKLEEEGNHFEASTAELGQNGSSNKAERAEIKNVPKKFWENSRLRIYFMSPVELEQKDVRQNLIQQKRKAVDTSKPAGLEQNEEKASKHDDTDEKPAANNEENNASDTVTGTDQIEPAKEVPKVETGDDLDGEPLSAEEQAAAAVNAIGDGAVDRSEDAEAAEAAVEKPIEESAIGEAKDEVPLQETSPHGAVEEASRQLSHPSADRLSIAYAQNTRRLVVDAEVVQEVVLHRAEGKIEINLRMEVPSTEAEGKGFRCARGVYIEKSASSADQGFEEIGIDELTRCWDADEETRTPAGQALDEENTTPDHLSPPLHYLLAKKSESSDDNAGEAELKSGPICTIIAKMDRAHPLTEAKWVRTGNADDWIQSVIGNGHNANVIGNNNKHSTITGGKATQQLPKGEQGRNNNNNNNNNDSPHNNAGNVKDGLEDDKNVTRESAWKGKIRVVDPDAPPTFQHALENWLSSANSRNGFDEARYKFVNTHFQDINNVLEVLLRLIRGSSSGGSSSGNSFGNSTSSAHYNQTADINPSQSTNLATQSKSLKAPYPEYQTPISLAAFQIFRMAIDSSSLSSSTAITNNNNSNGGKKQQQQQQQDINRKIGEIIRNLPYSLIFKSLDSMFTDYKRGNLG